MDAVVVVGIVIVLVLGVVSRVRKPRRHVIGAVPLASGGPSPVCKETVLSDAGDAPSSSPEGVLAETVRTARADPKPEIGSGPVTVFETYDAGDLLVAKSLLEAADIPYYAKGEVVQDIIGIGRLWGGCNFAIGPVALQVPAELAAQAQAVFEDLTDSA